MNNLTQLQPLFEKELMEELTANAKYVHLQAGETILKVGQIIRQIPIVLEGSVKVSRLDEEGRELLLYYVNPNESCAMSLTCCMDRQTSEIKAVTEIETDAILIPHKLMESWMDKYTSWKSFVMKTIRLRFNEMLHTIDQIAFQNLDTRLVQYLKEKSKINQSKLINLSHQQIADDLATSRVVISRLLKKLENDKKLLLYRHQIKLLGEL
jgi:CRP/FNR family transcriptional regulator, anaerobic regulatory protein